MPAGRWRNLQQTKRRLEEGGTLHVVNLGDSIVNDTARSAWMHLLREQYPKCRITMTTVVRGGTGCWWYRHENRIEKLVAPLKPDLVLIGGLSQRGDVESIQDVIGQLRRQTSAEIILGTAAFGRMDPHDPDSLKQDPCSGYGEYGGKLQELADREDRTGRPHALLGRVRPPIGRRDRPLQARSDPRQRAGRADPGPGSWRPSSRRSPQPRPLSRSTPSHETE